MTTISEDIAAIAKIAVVPTILDVICRSTGLGFAVVARVTEDRWVTCAVLDRINFGLQPGDELDVKTTICDEIRSSGDLVVINHVAEDEAFCRHPTPARYGFQSYISVPIHRASGAFFGTLCAIHPEPAMLNTPETVGMFQLFANLIGQHLDAQERISYTEQALTAERQQAELREQFIAVLGHDLRNPLGAVDAGARVLLDLPLEPRAHKVTVLIRNSAARMGALVDNLVDFARGRLGGGLSLAAASDVKLQPVVSHVIAELRLSWPERQIVWDGDLASPVRCDPARIGQLLSNLVANALTHGDPAAGVAVQAATTPDGGLVLAVVNQGPPIPVHEAERLFQPFYRGASHPAREGLGLGLYIASEIAKAHGGSLSVRSVAGETRFTFTMPGGGASAGFAQP